VGKSSTVRHKALESSKVPGDLLRPGHQGGPAEQTGQHFLKGPIETRRSELENAVSGLEFERPSHPAHFPAWPNSTPLGTPVEPEV
jgi:hypothetical protein